MRVLEYNSFVSEKTWFFALVVVLCPFVAMGDSHVLNIGGQEIVLSETCDTDHKLNVLYDDRVYCAPLTAGVVGNSLHVLHNGTTYSVCNGACDDIMPEIAPEPIQIADTCTWTQSNANAYLLSDGNQYFDTGVQLDSTIAMDITMEIVNGVNARLFGSNGNGGCYYDMTINANSDIYFRIGTSSLATVANANTLTTGKHLWEIKNNNSDGTAKYVYQDGKRVAYKGAAKCTSTDTILVFRGIYLSNLDYTNNGGMKLYSIKMYNKGGTLIHDYQPVSKGTDICGTIVATNAMWDFVTKKLYYPGGTGQMGYGVD